MDISYLCFSNCGSYLYLKSWYNGGLENRPSDAVDQVIFTVEAGESSDSIASRLEEEGLINSANVFKLYLRFEDRASEIQAGSFKIPRNSTIPEIVDILGNAIKLDTVKVTIIEGYQLTKIDSILSQKFSGMEGSNYSSQEFKVMTEDPDSQEFETDIQEFLDTYKPAGKKLEGFLYPDTYEFENSASTKYIVETLIRQFINKTQNLDKGDNFYNSLILASIIERESFTNEEKPLISSVFHNRLNAGMALQSDATVNYATGVDNPQTTDAERATNSPYNTYKYPGLPPTPINSPRYESIEAAINPAKSDYFFFLHEQDGSGQVHFAKTLAEHNENRRLYLD